MRTNFPVDLLRSFVAVADLGSLSAAANDVFLTQSALSLQMKRLADLVQAPILTRHHRGVLLTPEGKILLSYARAILNLNDQASAALVGGRYEGPVRIGMIQDFASGPLSDVLLQFTRLHPGAHLQIQVSNSSELLAFLAGGVVDLVVCLTSPDDAAAIIRPEMLWLGHQLAPHNGMLALALMEKPCLFRSAALAALDEAGIAYRIALETPNVAVLCAAVRAGIGVTCRTNAFLDHKLPVLTSLDLPLPQVAVSLHSAAKLPPEVERLAALMRNAIIALGSPA